MNTIVSAGVMRMRRHGGPEVFEYEQDNLHPPKPDQVLLRQTAIGVNFLDIYHRRGETQPLGDLPFVNGFEGAGIVEAVGDRCDGDFDVGDRVGYTLAPGAYATRRLISSSRLVRLPDDVTDIQAASGLLKGTTAECLVNQVYRVKPGDLVLVHAAAGGVGLLLTQWAKHLGARVIGTVGSSAKAHLARTLGGCDQVIVLDDTVPDFTEAIVARWGPDSVSVVYDGVAGPTLHLSLKVLAIRGFAVVTGYAGGKAAPVDVHALKAKSLTVISPSLPHFTGATDAFRDSASALFDVVQSGAVRLAEPNIYSLRDVSNAHAALESRATTGPVVLIPD